MTSSVVNNSAKIRFICALMTFLPLFAIPAQNNDPSNLSFRQVIICIYNQMHDCIIILIQIYYTVLQYKESVIFL